MVDAERLAGLSVSDVLQQWPQTADAFQRRRMACIGCALAPFFTIADVVDVYGLSNNAFLEELLALIGDEQGTPDPPDRHHPVDRGAGGGR
jgi:hybrid cluster-associated redox disulfide protein